MNGKLVDLRQISGFLNQSLYKNSNNEWIDIYYWQTLEEAHNSNSLMGEKDSFQHLLSLVDQSSVRIEVLPLLQSSGKILF